MALFALEMILSGRYGFHRDELYFLDCARHLQGGYVDQPVLIPLLAKFSLTFFGTSLSGLRVWSALAVAATVIMAGLIARELGGGRNAQIVAAVATLAMPSILAAGDLFSPTTLDVTFWTALALVVIRIGRTGDSRYWLLAGLLLGLGLANKHSIGLFAAALLLGVVLNRGWRLLANVWALGGLVIAFCLSLPDLWWQATHNWPTIAMSQTLNQENGGLANIPTWVVGQLLMVNVVLMFLWLSGFAFLWRSRSPLWRALAWAYLLLFLFFALTTGAKTYYLAAAYVYLLAAGATRLEGWWAAHKLRSGLVLAGTCLTTLIILPIALPILPPRDIGGFASLNTALEEEVGWPNLVHTVRHVWLSVPPQRRARTVIFTADYGEAGAINELGRGLGLPVAVSGHNNEWYWGPGIPDATTVLAVAPGPEDMTNREEVDYLSHFFRHIRIAATFRNAAGLHNQEWDGHVYLCTGLKQSWATMWPRLRQYS